jgi:hypothetical protein
VQFWAREGVERRKEGRGAFLTFRGWSETQERRERWVLFMLGAISGGVFVGLVILVLDAVAK